MHFLNGECAMKRFVYSIAFAWLSTAMAAQAVDRERVVSLLDEGEFAVLEAVLAEAHTSALAERDFSQLRDLYDDVFRASHPARMKSMARWMEYAPETPYAATALAYAHFHRSAVSRGYETAVRTAPEAFEQSGSEMRTSKALSRAAWATGKDFVPLLDLLVMQFQGQMDAAVLDLVDRTLELDPSRRSIVKGIDGLAWKWGGGPEALVSLCDDLTEAVPEYDTEACFLEAAFRNRVRGEPRAHAVAALAARGEDWLDSARFEAYLWEWQDRPEAADFARNYVRREIEAGRLRPHWQRWAVEFVSETFNDPMFQHEGLVLLREAALARLPDDPQHPDLLYLAIDARVSAAKVSRDPTKLGDAWRLWTQALVLGAHRPDTWAKGADIVEQERQFGRPERLIPFVANEVVSANFAPMTLHLANFRLGQRIRVLRRELEGDALESATHILQCEALRLSGSQALRLAALKDAVCGSSRSDRSCQTGPEAPRYAHEIGEAVSACGFDPAGPPGSFAYVFRPLSEFTMLVPEDLNGL